MDRIKEIYRSILQNTEEMRKYQKAVDEQIDAVMAKEREEMTGADYENCREKYYQIADLAEEGGFVLGFQYAVQLMQECSGK